MTSTIRFCYRLIFASLLFCSAGALRAENQTVLLLENIGLKNLYRVVFQEWNEENHFASGVLEINPLDDSDSYPGMRVPFRADIKPDPKNKGTEILEVSSIALAAFYPPADKKEPYPHVIWKVTGRKGKSPTMKAKLWTFGKSAWALEEMEFEKPAKEEK